LAQGKILISSQEIPTELVRPTVSALSNERIQYIQQRIMTRDNLLALAKKFNLSMGWQGLVSGSEIVDFIRDRTQIKSSEVTLQGEKKQAIAFTIGFEYEQPQTATRVANELVTLILNEDVRTRTNYASETTKFLEKEVKRLEDQLGTINNDISERQKLSSAGSEDPADDAKNIAGLKAQLAVLGVPFALAGLAQVVGLVGAITHVLLGPMHAVGDFHARKPKKVFHVPGAPLEVRWAWGPNHNYAFTAAALSSKPAAEQSTSFNRPRQSRSWITCISVAHMGQDLS
jgi:hypothetical protein